MIEPNYYLPTQILCVISSKRIICKATYLKKFTNTIRLIIYPQDHKLYSEENKNIIGKMKDETVEGKYRNL